MCVYVCLCVCEHVYVWVEKREAVCLCVCVCLSVCLSVCLPVCVMYVCLCVCVCVYVSFTQGAGEFSHSEREVGSRRSGTSDSLSCSHTSVFIWDLSFIISLTSLAIYLSPCLFIS